MKCTYVAGSYSASDILTAFGNMRRGIKASVAIRQAGFSPFVPWCDILLHLQEGCDLETCYAMSIAWMEKADAVLVVPEGAAQSRGTQAELKRARELGIPIFDCDTVEKSITEMRRYFTLHCHEEV